MRDLGTLGGGSSIANGINDAGQVVANAGIGIIPEPEISALLLTGLVLIGFMARRKKMGAGDLSSG